MSGHDKTQVVYFNRVEYPPGCDLNDAIKVGYSRDHANRMKEHRQSKLGLRVSLKELCVVRGTRADEDAIKRYFAADALEGESEVFHATERLVDYVRWMRDQYFVWVPDDDNCPEIAMLEEVEPSHWMPNESRRKPAPKTTGLFPDPDFGPLNIPPRELTIDDFYTNEAVTYAARVAMGGIDLDPASHALANKKVKATAFYSKREDGLAQLWHGRVWLNPPFSEWQKWVPKIVGEWQSGRIESMCVLCATRTLTAQYFGPIHENASALCIIHGRLPFWGSRAGSPDDGHAVFYFGKDVGGFKGAFSDLGYISQPI